MLKPGMVAARSSSAPCTTGTPETITSDKKDASAIQADHVPAGLFEACRAAGWTV